MTHLQTLLLGLGALVLAGLVFGADKSDEPPRFTAGQLAFYDKEVLPLLKAQCYKCHAGPKIRGGLRLDSRAAILRGGDLGPAVQFDKLVESPLVKAIHHRDGLEMPPSGKLPPAQVAILARWIDEKLPMPVDKAEVVKAPEHSGRTITQEERNWWAYRPLVRPAVPRVKRTQDLHGAIDAFLQIKIEEKGLRAAEPADRVTLGRRIYHDLTGLPPTPEQLDAFVTDRSPDAYERLVDQLLASPAYGEKWGRHWLDLVRFAETNGYERDGPKPFAWRFRDYVIRSFNADKPYDQFIREQLAGDELPGNDSDAIIATGYYRLGLWDDEPADPKQSRADEIDDWITTTGQVFLGMTLNCARCHDHKKDPILQRDYYKMVAFFQDVRHFSNSRDPRSAANLTDISPPEERVRYEAEERKRQIRKADLATEMRTIEDEVIKKMPAEEQRAAEGIDRPQVLRKIGPFLGEYTKKYKALQSELRKLERMPNPATVLALSVNNCVPNPPATNVMIRGNPHALGEKVEPGFPTVFQLPDPVVASRPRPARTSGRRSVLASWIASKDNRMTARVMANRLWQYHFGRGIVPSSSDFGKLGELPTHPELLDWLASELIAGDWQIKRLHRQILLSSAYRRSSKTDPEAMLKDPGNSLYWRFGMRRLAAEEVRDAILAVSGQLNRVMAGPGIYPTIPRAVLAGQSRPGEGWGNSPPAEQARRSVYVHVKRSLVLPILQTHDQADTDTTCPVRYTTTVPTQALGMLNGEFTNEQASAFAQRLEREASDVPGRVQRAIRLTTGRKPAQSEVERDVKFVADLKKENALGDQDALRLYCLMLLNTNEFLYLD